MGKLASNDGSPAPKMPDIPSQPSPNSSQAKRNESISEKMSDTTRYISALVYQSWKFCNRVLQEIVDQKYKAIAPNYGIDLDTVLGHCRRARRNTIIRNFLLGGTLLIPFCSEGFFEALKYMVGEEPGLLLLFLAFYATPLVISLILGFGIVFTERLITEYFVLTKSFSKKVFGKSMESDGETGHGNVIVYGSYSPFVGSGVDMGGWSFSINIQRGKEHFDQVEAPVSFSITALYDFMTEGLHNLDLHGFSVEDKLFIDGRYIRENRQFLPQPFSRPIDRLAPEKLQEYVGYSGNDIRHYKQLQVIDWGGEIVVSIFLRFVKTKDHLFSEANYFLLPPLLDEFYKLDEFQPSLSVSRFARIFLSSLYLAPLLWIISPFFILYDCSRPYLVWKNHRETRKMIKRNPLFNYGATTSVRELASSGRYRLFFQKLDQDMVVKTVEKEILDLIIRFLDARNIDTSELRERETTILNNGVIVAGGSIKAESLAVGQKARASVKPKEVRT